MKTIDLIIRGIKEKYAKEKGFNNYYQFLKNIKTNEEAQYVADELNQLLINEL